MKKQILKELYESKGEYVSGEKLSQKLGISRTAVWKNIACLKKEGHTIESVRKRGYCLLSSTLGLSQTDLQLSINTKEIGKKIIYFDEIDSTNNFAKKIVNKEEHGTIVIANSQTAGRGRRGRNWLSPQNEGLWMSIILKPKIPSTEASKVTQIAAVAICQATRELCKCEALIKWPNDIVINGKKTCGILTEMAGELGEVNYIIVGIGINVNTKRFNEELGGVATSLLIETEKEIGRRDLFIMVIEKFEKHYQNFVVENSLEGIISELRKYSALLGKKIVVLRKNEKIYAIAKDITVDGGLMIKMDDNKEMLLNSGDVSIRGENNYI